MACDGRDDNYCALDHCYSQAIIIGNGPSGISLSQILSGNWPYFTGEPHPDPYLYTRLLDNIEQSLLEQDLRFLSNGLEGRSSNPVALLFDSLYQPNADLTDGEKSCLEWRHRPDKRVTHRVLGKGPPGGSWMDMDDSVHTLSLGRWMELPGVDFQDWVRNYRESGGKPNNLSNNRASLGEVARYYQEYVVSMNLKESFRPYTLVTSVQKLKGRRVINSESGEPEIQCQRCRRFEGQSLFEVKGHFVADTMCCDKTVCAQDTFTVLTPNVVLATGMLGWPNRLQVPGEDLPYILYTLTDLQAALHREEVNANSDPVLIVGSGLNAADAVMLVMNAGVHVVHAFRRPATDKGLVFTKLPKTVYPEYHQVHQMMKTHRWGGSGMGELGYLSLPEHTVNQFHSSGRVSIKGADLCGSLQVSVVVVLIGAKPDLSFLPNNGSHLGIRAGEAISCHHNPIDVDPYTLESRVEQGLYAMGPLVGDHFVRFAKGGALAVASNLYKTLPSR